MPYQEEHNRNIHTLNQIGTALEALPDCPARSALVREWQRLSQHHLRVWAIRQQVRQTSPPGRQ